ncbi:MAG: hypothetical protein ACK5BP_05945, partial [Planctomyces sp.]
ASHLATQIVFFDIQILAGLLNGVICTKGLQRAHTGLECSHGPSSKTFIVHHHQPRPAGC